MIKGSQTDEPRVRERRKSVRVKDKVEKGSRRDRQEREREAEEGCGGE